MWNFLEQEEEEKTRVAIRERSELENAMKKMFLIEGVEVEMADWMWDRSLLLFGTILRSMQVSIARGLLMQKEEVLFLFFFVFCFLFFVFCFCFFDFV